MIIFSDVYKIIAVCIEIDCLVVLMGDFFLLGGQLEKSNVIAGLWSQVCILWSGE